MPQGRNVFPRMSVRTNLELGGVSLGNRRLTRERIDSIAFELFPMLRAKADRQVSTLSGGEQKMLEIGRAMLLRPRLLLIDEPSVGLSPILVRQVFELMQQLRDRGTTVLMIEQNAKSALSMSDYGIVLQQGRVGLAGTAAEVLDHPEIGPLFLGGAVRGLGRTAPGWITPAAGCPGRRSGRPAGTSSVTTGSPMSRSRTKRSLPSLRFLSRCIASIEGVDRHRHRQRRRRRPTPATSASTRSASGACARPTCSESRAAATSPTPTASPWVSASPPTCSKA